MSAVRRLVALVPAVLHNRNVRSVWVTELGDAVDRAIRGVAVPWLILELTGDTVSLGLAFALYTAPDVLLAPVIGHVIDILPPRATLATGEVLQGLLVIALGILTMTDILGIKLLYGGLIGLSVVVGLTHNARRTLLPELADEEALDDANAALDAIRSLLGLLALAAGGWVVATLGTGQALVIAGAAPIVSAIALIGLDVPPRDRDAGRSGDGLPGHLGGILETARAGVSAIRNDRVIRSLLAFGVAINLLVVPLGSVLIPTLGQRVFESALALTVLLGGFRAGSFVGTLLVPGLEVGRKTLIVAGTILVGIGIFATGLFTDLGSGGAVGLAVATATLFGAGAGMPLFNVPSSSALQAAAPEARRGTVVTAVNATLQSVFPLPLLAAGWLLGTVPAASLFMWIGIGTLGVAGWTTIALRFEPGGTSG